MPMLERPADLSQLLTDPAIIIFAGLVLAILVRRLRLSPLLGYLVAGLLIGPFGFGLVRNLANIRFLADVGVVLLMFALGVQLSLRQLLESRITVLVAGLGHSLLTMIAGLVVSVLLGFSAATGLVMGYAIALCSSVVLVRLLSDEDAMHTAYGRTALGISILQDLLAVIMISTLPFLLGHRSTANMDLLFSLGKALLFVLLVILSARWVVPLILGLAASSGSREVFLLTILSLSLAGAIASTLAGFSLALGAFLAGLIISESLFSQAVLSEIIPLRDVFGLLFFSSLGMLVNPADVLAAWPLALALLLVALVGKSALIYGIMRTLKLHPYTAIITGIMLAQIGEFSFIIAREAVRLGVITTELNTVVLAIAIISIGLNPVLVPATRRLYRWLSHVSHAFPDGEAELDESEERPTVLLCGYGRVGHTIGQALDTFRVPFMVVEIDRKAVADLRQRGIRVVYGDATNLRLLERIGAGHFVLGVIAVAEADAVYTIAQHLRRICPGMRLLLRSHSERETALYLSLGVTDVVHVEMEASLVFIRQVLTTADVDEEIVDAYLHDIRAGYYEALGPSED